MGAKVASIPTVTALIDGYICVGLALPKGAERLVATCSRAVATRPRQRPVPGGAFRAVATHASRASTGIGWSTGLQSQVQISGAVPKPNPAGSPSI
jgi:hypothetical protein